MIHAKEIQCLTIRTSNAHGTNLESWNGPPTMLNSSEGNEDAKLATLAPNAPYLSKRHLSIFSHDDDYEPMSLTESVRPSSQILQRCSSPRDRTGPACWQWRRLESWLECSLQQPQTHLSHTHCIASKSSS